MSKQVPLVLATSKASSSTTLCLLRKIGPLPDNTYRYQCSLDRDVTYDDNSGGGAQVYKARIGYEASALVSTSDLGVDNAEGQMLVPLVSHELEGITKEQVDAGILDKVAFVVYEIDYNDLTPGHHEVRNGGTLGEVKWKFGEILIPEERSLSQQLKQTIVELDSKTCRAKFGSQPLGTGGGVVEERFPCGFDTSTLWVSGTVLAVGSETDREFADTGLTQGDDYFAPGIVEWLTGANSGQKQEVESFAEGTIVLLFPTVNPIQLGDTYRVRPDCTKQWFDGHSSCGTWWGSQKALHFRGEPHIPTGDAAALNSPGAAIGSAVPPGSTSYYPPPEPSGTPTTPSGRTHGATVVDPVTYGADPTGASDSTAAFNSAYAALPGDGGIVRPSAGTYKINPNVSIKPLSNTLLDLATHNVTLQASYTALDHKYVIWIQDVSQVEIAGGTIIGYRDAWSPISGTTSEWGHGIACYGSSHVTVRDITSKKNVGDGMSIGGHSGVGCTDIVVDNVLFTDNRRQGLSIVWCNTYSVTDSTFSDTNGTSPECGIDIEPENGESVIHGTIDNCKFQGNAKYGINVLKRSGITATIDDLTVTGCLIGGDTSLGNHSNGVVLITASNVTFDGNTISYNSATGLRSTSVTNLTITNNTFKDNYTRNGVNAANTAHLLASGLPTETRDCVIVTAASGQSITNNTFWY